jgi:glycosyltransferase involved in cell wall biosynthesis
VRICHISSCFPPSRGGVETFVYNLSALMVERGHQVKVITSDRGTSSGKHREWINGIEVIRYPERLHLFEAPIIPQIALHLLREDYDVLHVHGMVPTISDMALIISKFKRKPAILTYHCDAETPRYGTLGKLAGRLYAAFAVLAIKTASMIVATTRSYAESSSVLSSALKKIVIVPCGVDTKHFFPSKKEMVNRRKNQTRARYILYVGKLIHYKGVDVLIKAFERVSNSFASSLMIIGDGDQRDELKQLTDNLKLTDQVTFAGGVPDESLPRYYQNSDLFVLPSLASRREAFGMVLLEAMACGKPVVASSIPGVCEVVENEETGLLAPPGSPEKLAQAILKLLGTDRLSEMGSYARSVIEKKYDWSVIAERYEGFYKSLIEEKR